MELKRYYLGVAIAVFCLIISYIVIKSIRTGNEKKAKIFSFVLSAASLLVDYLGFFAPGVQEYTVDLQSSNTIVNECIMNIASNPTINVDGILIGQNIENGISKLASSPIIFEAYEIVDNLPVDWWDNTGGRQAFSLGDINSGAVTPSIVFNSIVDSKIGNEFNFVGARENTGGAESRQTLWNADTIAAEEGKTYLVRLYAHNNNPGGYDAIAENVCVRFKIQPTAFVRHNDIALAGFNSANGYYGVAVFGILTSSNAVPTEYGDGVKFVSNRPFHLEYIPGTARLKNAAPGAKDGFILSDDVLSTGVSIGYEEINGAIPGCYQFDSVTTIIVIPVFDD